MNNDQPRGSTKDPNFKLKKAHYKLEGGKFILNTYGIIEYLRHLGFDIDSSEDNVVLKTMVLRVTNLKTKEKVLIVNHYDESNEMRFFTGIQKVYNKLKEDGIVSSPFSKSKE